MKIKNVILSAMILVSIAAVSFSGCKKDSADPASSQTTSDPNSSMGGTANSPTGGINSAIPAYYDAKLFKIIFVEFPHNAEATLIAKNPGINFIYQSDPGLPNNQPFISVIDAIPHDGMNPVWREVQITFNNGFTPRQLFSDNDVLAAASGNNPEISLTMTDEVYYCPVISHK